MKWKIGDRVRLTGRSWPSYESKVQRGTYHTVSGVNEKGPLVEFEGRPDVRWLLCKGWEIELIERKEETMSVDFSGVNVGDKVRLTRENGDETTFTVVARSESDLETRTDTHFRNEWDTLEIVERAFKPVPGLYTDHKSNSRFVLLPDGREYFTDVMGSWIEVDSSKEHTETYQAVQEDKGWRREITF